MKKFYVLSLLCLASGLVSAQDVIYRCGNEYTNNVSQAKAGWQAGRWQWRDGDSRHQTLVAMPQRHRPSPSRQVALHRARRPRPAATVPLRARDSDARAILQGELNKAQARLAELKAEYNDGNPVRTALELRNPQGYPERVAKLKADITRQESDIAGIKRELDRLPAVN
jgi:hypothetical protein